MLGFFPGDALVRPHLQLSSLPACFTFRKRNAVWFDSGHFIDLTIAELSTCLPKKNLGSFRVIVHLHYEALSSKFCCIWLNNITLNTTEFT